MRARKSTVLHQNLKILISVLSIEVIEDIIPRTMNDLLKQINAFISSKCIQEWEIARCQWILLSHISLCCSLYLLILFY